MQIWVEVPNTKRAKEFIEWLKDVRDTRGHPIIIVDLLKPYNSFGKDIIGITASESSVNKIIQRARNAGLKPLFIV
jgi:hypothetical protein